MDFFLLLNMLKWAWIFNWFTEILILCWGRFICTVENQFRQWRMPLFNFKRHKDTINQMHSHSWALLLCALFLPHLIKYLDPNSLHADSLHQRHFSTNPSIFFPSQNEEGGSWKMLKLCRPLLHDCIIAFYPSTLLLRLFLFLNRHIDASLYIWMSAKTSNRFHSFFNAQIDVKEKQLAKSKASARLSMDWNKTMITVWQNFCWFIHYHEFSKYYATSPFCTYALIIWHWSGI